MKITKRDRWFKMAKTVKVSDKAYALVLAHARANGETIEHAMDELFGVANEVWAMDMPEMRTPWRQFKTGRV
jgi:hypothetical protein